MADIPNGKATHGTQAYRWLLSIGMGLIVALSWRVLQQVDNLASKVEALQIDLTTLRGEVGAAKFAIDGVKAHTDTRLGDHQRQIDEQRTRNNRQDQTLEDWQRSQWQQRR